MKENGFAIGLLVGTLVIGGGLVALGVMQGNGFAEAEGRYSEIKDDVESMARVRPYPSEENLEEREKEVKAFRGKVEALQNALQAYRPESMEKISPSEFQNRVVSKASSLGELFDSKGIEYPEQFALGFERYKDELANPEATGKLNYQLEATEWLFRQLASVDTYAIRNARREALPSESGEDWLEDLRVEPLYQSVPMEVVLLAEEKAVDEIINKITSSKEYFFTVDMIRIGNENLDAPNRAQAGLEESSESAADEESFDDGGGFGAFGAFDDEEEAEVVEEEPAEALDSGRILGQVLGDEALNVGLQLRLLIFSEPVELPEIK